MKDDNIEKKSSNIDNSEGKIKFTSLGDSFLGINDSMSTLKNQVSGLNSFSDKYKTMLGLPSIYATERTDTEKIIDLANRLSLLEKTKTNSLNDLNKNINEIIKPKIEELKIQIESGIKIATEDSKNKYVGEIKKERNNIIGSLSLFVAFFTFISTNINIFSKVDNLFTALLLMFGMLISITMMLIVFFTFLHDKIKIGLSIFVVLIFILSIFGYKLREFFLDYHLTPSYEDRIKIMENGEINLEEKIKSLENKNSTLKEIMEQQISKEVQFQLLKQQSKNTVSQ